MRELANACTVAPVRVPLQAKLRDFLAFVRRPGADIRSDLPATSSTQPRSKGSSAQSAAASIRDTSALPTAAARKRRAESAEWPETQPWCHP